MVFAPLELSWALGGIAEFTAQLVDHDSIELLGLFLLGQWPQLTCRQVIEDVISAGLTLRAGEGTRTPDIQLGKQPRQPPKFCCFPESKRDSTTQEHPCNTLHAASDFLG
jgi:hypothetical protein